MKKIERACLLLSGVAAVLLVIGIITQQHSIWQPAAVICSICFAIGMGAVPALKSFRYTAWIIAAVITAMIYPSAFTHWGDFDLRNKWLILIIIQLVMFGMGIQMSIKDFTGIATTGKGVAIGLLCHFTIMPLMGVLLINIFHFEPEIAAGIILIGSCSSGLASNVMVYIARANLVLSVVVTAMSTLAAPFITPLLMKLLAGTLIEVKFINMMMEIIKIVIVPIGAALLYDYLKTASVKSWRIVTIISIVCIICLLALSLGLWSFIETNIVSTPLLQTLEIAGFFMAAFLIGVLYYWLSNKIKRL